MFLFEKLAEERIIAAMQRGELSGLAGEGKPLPAEDDLSLVPEDLRMACKILRNAGFTPPEIPLYREINNLVQSGAEPSNGDDSPDTRRRKLMCLMLQLSGYRDRYMNLALQDEYYRKVLKQISGT